MEPFYNGYHRDLKKCLLKGGVRYIEVLFKLALLLQIPVPKCIRTAQPYSPIDLPLFKLGKINEPKPMCYRYKENIQEK